MPFFTLSCFCAQCAAVTMTSTMCVCVFMMSHPGCVIPCQPQPCFEEVKCGQNELYQASGVSPVQIFSLLFSTQPSRNLQVEDAS